MKYNLYRLAALLILLAGCNLDENNTHKKPAHKVVKTDSPVVKHTSIQPQSQAEAGQYCYIKTVYNKEDGAAYIDADYIQFLMGDAAVAAAKKKKDSVMDDYYIINDNTKIRSLKLNARFEFTVVENDASAGKTAMDYLQSAIKNNWVLVLYFNEKGEVVRIKEQFLP